MEEANVIAPELAKSVKNIAKLNDESITTTMIEGNYLSEKTLVETVAAFYKWETVEVEDLEVSEKIRTLWNKEDAKDLCALVIGKEGNKLRVLIDNPYDQDRLSKIQSITQCEIIPVFSVAHLIQQKIEEVYLDIKSSNKSKKPSQKLTSSFIKQIPAKSTFAKSSTKKMALLKREDYQEYPLEDNFPLFLTESLKALRKFEQMLKILENFYQQIYTKETIDEILEEILDAAFSLIPLESAFILLDKKNTGQMAIEKSQGIGKEKDILKDLKEQVEENHSIMIVRSPEINQLHVGVPIICRNKFLGVLYLISPENQAAYEKETLKMLVSFVHCAAVSIENEILRKALQERR